MVLPLRVAKVLTASKNTIFFGGFEVTVTACAGTTHSNGTKATFVWDNWSIWAVCWGGLVPTLGSISGWLQADI